MSDENKRIYIDTSDKTTLVLSMLELSKSISGVLPTKDDFYQSLKEMDVEPTPDLIKSVKTNYPSIGL